MKKYDYMETVKTDAINWTRKNVNIKDFENLDSLRRYTLCKLSRMDSVTGGETGKYTGTVYSIEETIAHIEQNITLYHAAIIEEVERAIGKNLNILVEAILSLKNDLGDDDAQEWLESNKNDPHALDAMIRCYLLPDAVDQVVTELLPDIEKSQASAS